MSHGCDPSTPMPAYAKSSVTFRAAGESLHTFCLSEFRDWDSCQPSKVLVLFIIVSPNASLQLDDPPGQLVYSNWNVFFGGRDNPSMQLAPFQALSQNIWRRGGQGCSGACRGQQLPAAYRASHADRLLDSQ